MSRHPSVEHPSAPVEMPAAFAAFSRMLAGARQGQAACPTVLALAFGHVPHFATDAARLCALMGILAGGTPVPPTACGAFNRVVARRLAASGTG